MLEGTEVREYEEMELTDDCLTDVKNTYNMKLTSN